MQGQDTGILNSTRRRYDMQPEVVAFMAAVVLAVINIIRFWIVWERRYDDEE